MPFDARLEEQSLWAATGVAPQEAGFAVRVAPWAANRPLASYSEALLRTYGNPERGCPHSSLACSPLKVAISQLVRSLCIGR